MGRAAIVIHTDELQKLINEVESKNTFPNWTVLCQEVSNADTSMACCMAGHKHKQIHQGQVYLAIKRGDVAVATPKGKRGGGVREGGAVRVRRSRGERFKGNLTIQNVIKKLREDAPEKYHPLIDKAEGGSKDAFTKLMCVQCMGYSNNHKSCDADGTTQPPCPLYPLNLMYWPNRGKPDIYDPTSKQ